MNEFLHKSTRTNDPDGSGHDAKRVDNSKSGIVAPDSDGLVCELCGGGVDRKEGKRVIVALFFDYGRGNEPFREEKINVRACSRCHKHSVECIKNILQKYPATDDVEKEVG
jgi:hypothetical protein